MAMQPWLYTFLAIIGIVHVVAFGLLWWKLERTDRPAPDGATTVSGDASDVTCSQCGATNERDYRFCGECVAELPGRDKIPRSHTSPTGREIF